MARTLLSSISENVRVVARSLVCSAQYTDSYGEQRSFRQFFKFQVRGRSYSQSRWRVRSRTLAARACRGRLPDWRSSRGAAQVLNPIKIQKDVRALKDCLFLQCTIENIAPHPLCIEVGAALPAAPTATCRPCGLRESF